MNRGSAYTAYVQPARIALAALAVLVVLSAHGTQPSAAEQPIAFNHKAHVKLMACSFCHQTYETREVAGRPSQFRCMLCHTYPVSKSPKVRALTELAAQRQDIPWLRLTRVAPFVRFSHRRHVAAGRVDCSACHGDIAQAAVPPARPLLAIDMQFCLDCHRAAALQLSVGALQALQAASLRQDLLAALAGLERRRFASGAALLAGLGPLRTPPGEEERRAILSQLRPAPPVTVDCIACHR